MTHQANLEFCFLDIKRDSQPNPTPDSDPGSRTCSGKTCFVKKECRDLEKIKSMYPKITKMSFNSKPAVNRQPDFRRNDS